MSVAIVGRKLTQRKGCAEAQHDAIADSLIKRRSHDDELVSDRRNKSQSGWSGELSQDKTLGLEVPTRGWQQDICPW